MPNPLERMLGVDEEETQEVDETEVDDDIDEEETPEVDESVLKYEAGKKALREERKRVRELQAELKAARAGKEDEDVRETIRAEVAREFGLELAKESARSLLQEAGYRGNIDRGLRALERDLGDVLDSRGKVNREALSDLVADWKDDEPQLFKRSRKTVDEDDEEDDAPRRKPASADLGRKPKAREQDNPLAKMLESMVGNPRLQ